MCGLAGAMSSSLSNHEVGMFKDLFNIASLRGSQGAGVIVNQREYGHKKQNIVRSLRTVGISGNLAYGEKFNELVKPRVNVCIGHARFPTKGGVDIKAVHPHRTGHIIGVHNGTMWKVGGEDVKDRSDSQMLFESFAKNGVIETIKESEGAYALIWIDEKDQTLNFLRNSQRTLFFKNIGWNKNIQTVYWSSECEMLDLVFGRSYSGTNTWDTFMPTDKWIKYPLDVSHSIRACDVIEDVKPKPRVYNMGNWVGRGHGHSRGQHYEWPSGDDLPWERISGPRANDADPLEGLVFNPETQRMEPKDNVLRLPSPHMSKQQQKKLSRELRREAANRQKRLKIFRGEHQDLEDISDAMAEIVDPSEDADDFPRHELPFSGNETILVGLEGKECSWCGVVASVGDRVHSTGSRGEFVCDDCGRNPDVSHFIIDQKLYTVGA